MAELFMHNVLRFFKPDSQHFKASFRSLRHFYKIRFTCAIKKLLNLFTRFPAFGPADGLRPLFQGFFECAARVRLIEKAATAARHFNSLVERRIGSIRPGRFQNAATWTRLTDHGIGTVTLAVGSFGGFGLAILRINNFCILWHSSSLAVSIPISVRQSLSRSGTLSIPSKPPLPRYD